MSNINIHLNQLTVKVTTYDTMIPNVIRLPSIMIKLPLRVAGEHSAWYDGTVDVWKVIFNAVPFN